MSFKFSSSGKKEDEEAVKAEFKRLWTVWETSTNLELEATFPVPTYVDYLHVVQTLDGMGLSRIPLPPKLNIIIGNIRLTIAGEAQINAFVKTEKLNTFTSMIKERYGTKEISDHVPFEEYGVNVKVRRELNIDNHDPRIKATLGEWATNLKTFRYMQRISYKSTKNPGIQFDITIVRQSKAPSTTLRESRTMSLPNKYEVEVEALRNIAGSFGQNGFLNGILCVLRGLQQSYVVLPKSLSESVLRGMAAVTGSSDFPGSQPATLMMDHIAMEKTAGTSNIRFDDYNVTDKADGDRCLLYVAGDGRVYLINKDLQVYGTDRQIADPTCVGILLDGEWIHQNQHSKPVNHYYAFDIYNGRNGVDVTKLPFYVRIADAETRLKEMQEVVALLRDAAYVVKDIPSSKSFQISMKTFQPTVDPAVPGGIFAEALSVLNRKESPYHTDGLIFTPNATPLPKGKGSWTAQLKWKPAEENTIDFLVRMEPGSSIKSDGESLVACKILHLYVGSSTQIQFRDPRKTILEEDAIAPPPPLSLEKGPRGDYKPLEFISDPYDPYASICYVPLEDGNIYTNRSKDIILDSSIVEMAYHPERPVGFRWEPTRVRWDKTSRFQHGKIGRTLNNDTTAQSIWTSIHEPITKQMICTGILSSGKEEDDMAKLYYKVGISPYDKVLTKGLQQFHNRYIKDKILLKSTLQSFKNPILLDMSCGKGGDLDKWIKYDANFVLGCDIAESGLIDPRDSIYMRYIKKIQEHGGRDRIAPMVFIQADASKSYADGTAGMTPEDRTMLRSLWGHTEPTVPAAVRRVEGIATRGFDVLSIMFTLHYMFRDRTMFDGWLMNVADALKVDGYLVGACFDGDTVAKALAAVPEGKLLSGIQKETTVWSIRKQYDDAYTGYLPPTEDGLGQSIDVYFASIGEEHTEYLVSFPYLVKRLQEIGCELMTDDECRAIGLQHSTAMFETSRKMGEEHGESYSMIPVVKQYSYFHRWFIFKRKTIAVKGPAALPAAAAATDIGVPPSLIIHPREDAPAPIIIKNRPPVDDDLISLEDLHPPTPPSMEVEEPMEKGLAPVAGPILKFYEKSVEKDDLKIKMKSWARTLSTAAPFSFHDREDPSIVYPNLEAAMAAEKFILASEKPELGRSIFPSLTDIAEIRKRVKDVKKYKFNEDLWNSEKELILDEYIYQRYAEDEEFQTIMEAVKTQGVRLVFYTGPTASNELGGLVKGDSIEGENLYGRALMALVGTTYE